MQMGAAYIRVSKEEQMEYSPDAQLNGIHEYAKKNNIILSNEFIFKDEGIPGRSSKNRPAFQEMIRQAKTKPKPFDIILVHKFDRFARNKEDSVVYKSLLRKDCNIKVVSITEQMEDGKFAVILESMLEAMAEYYSLNLAEEVKKGLFEKARRGENIGKAPLGYELHDGKLVPHEIFSTTVKMIFELAKTESISKIVRVLNQTKTPSRYGGIWTPHTIKYILQNPAYYGVTRYNYREKGRRELQNDPSEWIIVESNHEPLISKENYDIVQDRLSKAEQIGRFNLSEKKIRSWLQHLLKCKNCGRTLTISTSNKDNYSSFRCSAASLGFEVCKSVCSVKKLEKIVLEKVMLDINDTSNIIIEKTSTQNTHELEGLKANLSKIKTKHTLVKNAYLAQIDTLEEYKHNKRKLSEEEENIKKEIERLSVKSDTKTLELDSFAEILNSTLDIEEKNKIAKQFIKEVQVDLKDKQIRIFYYV
ncbi:MAG: recombinase family protein [Defluviitaleaceae bacterium]|nr:recombinase family protein [Defluviitaleaceae bacterium]